MILLHLRWIISASAVIALGLLSIVTAPAAQSPSDLGLTVNSQGTLLHRGTAYRGIGVNYYDAFLRTLRDPGDDSYKAGLAQLSAHGIPFARFSAGAFRASDLQLYMSDKEAYFQRLDGVVRAAEQSHVGLIPSLFWSISAISDLVHEPRERWADGSSQTRQFMRRYTHDVVSRYVDSPAIWGWEFSNELSLPVDMRPGAVAPEHALSYDTFRSAALDFAKVVREIDPHRILLTGDSLPRPNAYHNAHGGGPGPDTEEEFARILLRDNPGPFSPICIHASQAKIGRYFADRQVSLEGLLDACVAAGESERKPVYLEEFIPLPRGPSSLSASDERQYFTRQLSAVEHSKVPIASVWMYDRKLASGPFNLTFNSDHAYMLEMIGAYDRSLHR
jgi:hypothetical protein